jgi:phosphoribosylformimino-5-aminoimidazole carboxamide ribotide isomerase
MKKQPNFNLLGKIIDHYEFDLIIDPGIISIDDVMKYYSFGIKKLILGLETLKNLNVLIDTIDILGINNLYISLDMFSERVITEIKEFKHQSAINVTKELDKLGIQKIILLDLYRVGQKMGGIPPLYHKIRKLYQGKILVGGGIKNLSDIKMYYTAGFSGVLIGTALYDGSINIQKLRNLINKYDSRSRDI